MLGKVAATHDDQDKDAVSSAGAGPVNCGYSRKGEKYLRVLDDKSGLHVTIRLDAKGVYRPGTHRRHGRPKNPATLLRRKAERRVVNRLNRERREAQA